MERQITLLTVSQPIAPGDGGSAQYAPFAGAGSAPFLLEDPVLSTMSLRDDDDQFVSGFYSGDATQQALTQPTVIGYGASQITLPTGTRVSNFIGSVLTDDAGNRFVALYPRRFEPWDLGEELGDGHTVLIIPLPARQPDDSLVYPVFDPSRPVRFTEVRGLGPAPGDAIAYAPAAAPGPVDPGPVDVVPCFAADTRIQTAIGTQPVQALRPGDLILTRDHGFQPLLWSGSRVLDGAHLDLMPQHRPIRIAPGALGPDQPACALTVSPQHRILLRSRIAQRMFGTPEILVPARRLIDMAGVEVLRETSHVTYWHLLFRRHEIVLSEGAWTESLLPGPQALRAFDPHARARIVKMAPDLTARPAPARPIPPGHAQRRLVQRHQSNRARPLVEPEPEPVT